MHFTEDKASNEGIIVLANGDPETSQTCFTSGSRATFLDVLGVWSDKSEAIWTKPSRIAPETVTVPSVPSRQRCASFSAPRYFDLGKHVAEFSAQNITIIPQ